jgi:hypothetical protein
MPGAAELGFYPGAEIHRTSRWYANVAEVSIHVARRYIQATTKSDGQVSEIPADASAFVVDFQRGAG